VLREQLALQQLLLLAVAREQVEQLDLERRARLAVVERLQERVLLPFLEQARRVEPLGEPLGSEVLPTPIGPSTAT
jgi:hypothetical protein